MTDPQGERLTQAARAILARPEVIVKAAVDEHYRRKAALTRQYGLEGKERCLHDTTCTLRFLGVALAFDSEPLFGWYAEWLALVLERLGGVHRQDVIDNIDILGTLVAERIAAEDRGRLVRIVESGKARASAAVDVASKVVLSNDLDSLRASYLEAQLRGDRHPAAEIACEYLTKAGGISAVIADVLRPCQLELGRRWHRGEISVAQEHLGTAVTQFALAVLYTRVDFNQAPDAPVVVAACPPGELHELAMRMIAEELEEGGCDVRYVGANTPLRALTRLVDDVEASCVVASASMAYNLPAMASLIEAVRGSQSRPPVIVGGLPFEIDPALGTRLGADLMTSSVEEVLSFLKTHEKRH